ncbi:ANTAR domain-containing protein [Streptomyces sp. NPDC059371]|uniref:ANTAR domain-containing protein n=1 Tax=Streptomyces sp. NPDC059371 TaxID=3346812 RepID=UPI0036B2F381
MTVAADEPKPTAHERPVQLEGERVGELENQNARLQEAVRSHAVVDQAIGVVLAVGRLTPDQGWDILREISQRTNIKLRHVAELIIDWAQTGQLCTDIRTELDKQLAQYAQPPLARIQFR